MKHCAFPILDVSGAATTHLEEVVHDVLPRVQAALWHRCGATTPGSSAHGSSDSDGLPITLVVGDTVEVPFTCLGRRAGGPRDDTADLVLHCPGLPGALVTPLTILRSCRGQWRAGSASSSSRPSELTFAQQLGTLCCLEAVQNGWQKDKILDTLYCVARRRHFSVVGTECLLERGAQLNRDALDLRFPYHCGGVQATKRYFDIRPEVCTFCEPHGGAHGTRCLSRYGTAVSVGVSVDDDDASVPQLYWHPTGAVAACLAPALSGCPLLPVGDVRLPYNGPLRDSDLLRVENPKRYMQLSTDGSPVDTTTWLCEGLFGVRPDTAWRGPPQQKQSRDPLSVVGVGFNQERAEMELLLRNERTGDVFAADDV